MKATIRIWTVVQTAEEHSDLMHLSNILKIAQVKNLFSNHVQASFLGYQSKKLKLKST